MGFADGGRGVVLGLIVFVEHPLRREKERQASRTILPGLDPSLVTNIEIQPWGQAIIQAVRLGSPGSSWSLARPVVLSSPKPVRRGIA